MREKRRKNGCARATVYSAAVGAEEERAGEIGRGHRVKESRGNSTRFSGAEAHSSTKDGPCMNQRPEMMARWLVAGLPALKLGTKRGVTLAVDREQGRLCSVSVRSILLQHSNGGRRSQTRKVERKKIDGGSLSKVDSLAQDWREEGRNTRRWRRLGGRGRGF